MKKIGKNVFILVLLLLLAACGNSDNTTSTKDSGDKTSDKVEITVWADDPNFNIPIFKTAKEMYEKEHPDVTINVEEVSDYFVTLNTVLSSGEKDGIPNVVRIEDYEGQKYLESYPDDFVDISDYIDYDDFASYKQQVASLDGKAYGIPFDSGVAGLFYRKDIYADAGYTEDDMHDLTWDEFIDIAKDVKEKSGKNVLGYAYPVPEEVDALRMMMQSVGTWYFDEKGEINLVGNEGLRQSLLTLKDLADADVGTGYPDYNARNQALVNQELISIAQGSWFTGTIKSLEDQKGLWAVTEVPRIDGVKNASNATNQGGSSFYILDTGDEAEVKATIDFMTTMFAGDDEFYDTILKNQSAITTYLPSQEGDTWQAEDEFFDGEQVNHFYAENMQKIPEISYGTQSAEVEQLFKTYLTDFYTEKMDVDELLKTVEEAFNSQFGY